MRRICVIGNSHIAAFKLGLGRRDGVSVTFFGSHAGTLGETDAKSGRLVPTTDQVRKSFIHTSGGQEEIKFADFDEVVLVGVGCGLHSFVKVFHLHRPVELHRKGTYLISGDALRSVFNTATKLHQAKAILRKIKSATSLPITVVPSPMPSEVIERSAQWEGFWSSDWPTKSYESYLDALTQLGCRVTHQPADTLAKPWLTKAKFSHGSVMLLGDLTTKHEEDEYWHMNPSYGSRMWDSLLS